MITSSTKILTRGEWREALNYLTEIDNVEESLAKIKAKKTSCASEEIGKRTIDTNGSNRKKTCFTQEVNITAREKRETDMRAEAYEFYKGTVR